MKKRRYFCFLVSLVVLVILYGCTPSETTTVTNTPRPAASDTPKEVIDFGEIVSYRPGQPENGLTLRPGGDHDVETIYLEEFEQEAFLSGNGDALSSADRNADPDYYIQFQVHDDFIYAAEPTSRVVFIIEYLDEGFDTFSIQYDALSGGPFGTGQFKDTFIISKTGTGEIKTAEIHICDANFANRDQDADFRISDSGDGAEIIFSVAVKKSPFPSGPQTINVDSCGADPFDDEPDSDAIQDCLIQVCSGDTVLFTSGVEDPDYQGYLIDKTIFLVFPGVKNNLTFRSTDESNHALLKATADLAGFVVHLYSRSVAANPGLIDNITIQNLNIDGNRSERVCTGELLPGQDQPVGEGENDNWGSWLPECDEPGDSWCNPGTLSLAGGIDHSDPLQDFETNPDLWSTGFVVRDVILSNTECGTAFSFSGAEYLIDSNTIDLAGDHTHAPGCTLTDPDDPVGAWADGITFIGPGHTLTNNLIMDPSDVGIVSFGGRDISITNNTIQARSGNHGMFAGIAMHPNTLGLIGGLNVSGNHIINQADTTCGGIHIGINLGVHAWANGCMMYPAGAAYGTPGECLVSSPAPEGGLCGAAPFCRTWGHIPAGQTLTLADNIVEGAQVSYVISGLDVLGELVLIGNQSINPQLVDWEHDRYCVWEETYVFSWGALDYVAFNPTIEDWTEQIILCAR